VGFNGLRVVECEGSNVPRRDLLDWYGWVSLVTLDSFALVSEMVSEAHDERLSVGLW
jgi:hypothetical protein